MLSLLAREVPPVQANDTLGIVIGVVLAGPVMFFGTYLMSRVMGASKLKASLVSSMVAVVACVVIVQIVPHIKM